MTIHKELGIRMKEYEYVTRYKVIPHTPTILRLDGKSFHTFTKGMNRPFDDIMHQSMCYAMEEAIKNDIQNAVFATTHSDEISILLKDYPNLNTEQWFAGIIQKLCSIAAASISVHFNDCFRSIQTKSEDPNFGLFDCRVFQVPKGEVVNYFIWRQQDATKNSIQMLGQSYFSHKELQGKSGKDIQHMLLTQKDINWNDIDVWKRRGSTCYRLQCGTLAIDDTPPIFSKDRDFINKHFMKPL
jgi:tRNA(His) 5'-end guanylyltransferase